MASSVDGDVEAVVGDECHIIAAERSGPRGMHTNRDEKGIDCHSNLVIMCKVHHKQIDDQFHEFTVERLREIKRQHELWVAEKLEVKPKKREPIRLRRIESGGELFSCIEGSSAHVATHAEPTTAEEADLLGGILQDISDYGDLYNDLEPAQRVRSAFDMNQSLTSLHEAGFCIHAGKGIRTMQFGIAPVQKVDWQIFVVHVARVDDARVFIYYR